MEALAQFILGEDHPEITLESSEDNYQAVLTLLKQANRSLDIYTRYFDGKLFDTQEIRQPIQELAKQHMGSQVRILVAEIEPLVKYGHRIVELSRRLSSYMELRTIHKDYKQFNESFFIIDGRGIIHRKYADRYEGTAYSNNPLLGKELTDYFNEVWVRSTQPPDARRLYI